MSQATIRIGRDEHVWSFDAQREPVAHVRVDDVIEIETSDCITGQVRSVADTVGKIDFSRVNSATGAIGVRMACEEASKLLVNQWGFSAEDAFMFLSVARDLGLAAYFHPSPGWFVARMRVPKLASNPGPLRL